MTEWRTWRQSVPGIDCCRFVNSELRGAVLIQAG